MAHPLNPKGPRPQKDFWPSWRYSPTGEGQIFNSPDEVPVGWTKKKGEAFTPQAETVMLDRDTLAQLLREKGITPLGHWSARHMKDLLE